MPNPIQEVKSELEVWLLRQPPAVAYIGGHVLGHLESAQIGIRTHPKIIEMLAEDVGKLEQAVRSAHS